VYDIFRVLYSLWSATLTFSSQWLTTQIKLPKLRYS